MAKVHYCTECDLYWRGDAMCPLCEHRLRLDALATDLQDKKCYRIVKWPNVYDVEMAMNRIAILEWTIVKVHVALRGVTAIFENPHYDSDAHSKALHAFNEQLDAMDDIRMAHKGTTRGPALWVKRLRQWLSE